MNLKLPIIASLTAIIMAQGGCYESAMRNNPVITFESQDSNVDVLLETEAPIPNPTVADVELPSEAVSMPDDPAAVHQGTHTYSGENFDDTCACSPTAELTRNFEFSGDTVSDGIRIYTKTGENTYSYASTGYRIVLEGGVETKVETEDYIVYIFEPGGFFLQNFTDVAPGEGDPCCYYHFSLQD